MKQIVILTSIDLHQAIVKNHPTSGIIHLISKNFCIFTTALVRITRATARKFKAYATFANLMTAIAAIAILVAIQAALVACDTDSIESRITLAASVITSMAALWLSMWKEGYFKPYNEK